MIDKVAAEACFFQKSKKSKSGHKAPSQSAVFVANFQNIAQANYENLEVQKSSGQFYKHSFVIKCVFQFREDEEEWSEDSGNYADDDEIVSDQFIFFHDLG